MSFLREFKSVPRGEEYGGSDGSCQARRLVRIQKLIEAFLTRQKIPTVDGFAHELGVSRATVERLLASREFRDGLSEAMEVHFTCNVKMAMDTVVTAMKAGSQATRLRAAMWLLERRDRLAKALEKGCTEEDGEDAMEEALQQAIARRNAKRAARQPSAGAEPQPAAAMPDPTGHGHWHRDADGSVAPIVRPGGHPAPGDPPDAAGAPRPAPAGADPEGSPAPQLPEDDAK